MPNLFSEHSFSLPAKHTINQKPFSEGYYLYSNLSQNITDSLHLFRFPYITRQTVDLGIDNRNTFP